MAKKKAQSPTHKIVTRQVIAERKRGHAAIAVTAKKKKGATRRR